MATDYTKAPTESIDQYNAHIGMSKGSTTEQDAYFQSLADVNPEAANNAMDIAGYSYSTAAPYTTPAPAAPGPIAVDSLKTPAVPLSMPSTTPTTPPDYYARQIAGIPTAASIVADTTPEQTTARAAQTSVKDQILSVLQKYSGKPAAQAAAETAAGIPDINKQLTDVTGQIVALQNEAKAIPLQIQQESVGRGVTAAGVAPIEAGRLRENAIKGLGLSSIAAVLQGNLALARQEADRAVATQFDPLQQSLNYLKDVYAFNQDALQTADKDQAAIIEAKLQDRQEKLDQAKGDVAKVLGLVTTAVQNGAPANVAQTALGMDVNSAITTLATYLKTNKDGFTLNPGDRRYDAQGNLIASAPAKTKTGTGTTFTTTQQNAGAAHAGIPIAQFSQLDPDTQNYFINSYNTFKTNVLNKVAAGEMTKQEAADIVRTSTSVPQAAKQYLLGMLGVSTADASTGGGNTGGFLSTAGSVLGGAASSVYNWLFR